jgi:hypothetical protein
MSVEERQNDDYERKTEELGDNPATSTTSHTTILT